MDLIGAKPDGDPAVSAKEGTGIPELLEAIVARVPPPRGRGGRPAPRADLRLLLRPVPRRDPEHPRGGRRGARRDGDRLRRAPTTSTRSTRWATSSWASDPRTQLEAGRGGLPGGQPARTCATRGSGDTIFDAHDRATELLPGYREVKSMVFAGLYPTDSDQYEELRDALEKLQLNDASLHYEPESSTALGFGFRCGFLGPAAHGDRAGAAGARVQPRPDHARCRPWSTTSTRPTARCCCWRTRRNLPDPAIDRPDRGAVREGPDHGARPTTSAAIMKLGTGAARGLQRACTTSTPRGSSSTSTFRWARSCSTSTTS